MTASETFKSLNITAQLKLEKIAKLINEQSVNQEKDPKNWGFVGNLERISRQLAILSNF